MKLEVHPGEIRTWSILKVVIDGSANVRDGKKFLVVEVDGARVDVVQESGERESFYGQWLIHNSTPVSV